MAYASQIKNINEIGATLKTVLLTRRSTPILRTISNQNDPQITKSNIAMYENLSTSNLLTGL
jgi:hypothetical protein